MKTVVVTGASAGLGRAIAREFARNGSNVGLIARGMEGLQATRREIERMGVRAYVWQADVADAGAIEAGASEIEATLGPIDVWVNNAMLSVFSPVKDMTADDYRRVTEVTYLGVVHGTLAALRRMLPRDEGAIIQVGSALAYRGIPLQSAYCAAKHAIQGFCDSLRSELLHDRSHVRLTMVQMPALNTPQFGWVKSRLKHKAQPVPPIYEPEVGAKAVVYAARHNRREILVGGPTIEAVLGNKFIPGLLDRYLADHGFQSQQTPQDEPSERPDNLYAPLDQEVDYGANGAFTHRARRWSPALWLDMHRTWAIAAGAAALLVGGILSTARCFPRHRPWWKAIR
jgi:short-subunit dehydrogenase